MSAEVSANAELPPPSPSTLAALAAALATDLPRQPEAKAAESRWAALSRVSSSSRPAGAAPLRAPPAAYLASVACAGAPPTGVAALASGTPCLHRRRDDSRPAAADSIPKRTVQVAPPTAQRAGRTQTPMPPALRAAPAELTSTVSRPLPGDPSRQSTGALVVARDVAMAMLIVEALELLKLGVPRSLQRVPHEANRVQLRDDVPGQVALAFQCALPRCPANKGGSAPFCAVGCAMPYCSTSSLSCDRRLRSVIAAPGDSVGRYTFTRTSESSLSAAANMSACRRTAHSDDES